MYGTVCGAGQTPRLFFETEAAVITHRIPDCVGEMPARRYIRRAWPLLAEREVRQAFARRDVKRNGARIAPEDTVRGGDELAVYINASFPLDVLFDDGRLLAVCKPQGLPVDVDREGVGADTLLERLRAYNPNARLLHRLDAQTGGVLLAALDEETYARGLTAFRERQLRKRYRAVALGPFENQTGELKDYIAKDAKRATVRVLRHPGEGAKPIVTRYRVLESLGRGFSLVELEPVTGRTHQLRAHMAFYGHPLLGDDKYGNRESKAARLHLWCRCVEPLAGALGQYEGRRFTAPEPDWGKEFGHSPDRL